MGSSSSQLTDGSVEYSVPEATKNSPRARARANPIYIAAGQKPQQNGRILQTSSESTPPSKRNANKGAKREGQNSTSTHGRLLWSSLFVLFAALDLILLALLIQVSVDLGRSGQAGRQSPGLLEDAPFCLPCSQVYLTELEVLQNRFQVTQRMDDENRTKLCCAETHDDLSTLIGNMYLSVHYNSDRAKGLVSLSNDTTEGSSNVHQAQLVLSLDHSKAPTEVNGTHAVPLVSNLTVEAKEYDSHSVIFHNGTVRVEHTGHYYIYSHIPFKFRSNSSSNSLTQFVFRIRNGGELLLLQNSVYPCVVSTESCEYSFVGGMFLLEKGDEISLRVSKFTCIEREKEMKFGMQRI